MSLSGSSSLRSPNTAMRSPGSGTLDLPKISVIPDKASQPPRETATTATARKALRPLTRETPDIFLLCLFLLRFSGGVEVEHRRHALRGALRRAGILGDLGPELARPLGVALAHGG